MNYKKENLILSMEQNKEAFSRLYEEIYADLYKMALYMMGNKEQAEDVVSETILDAFYGIGNLKSADKFEHWILKILTTKCKRAFKKRYSSFNVFHPDNVQWTDTFSVTSGNMEDQVLMTDILNAMSRLIAKDRIIISLCIVQGYSSFEAAQILSMNPATVRSRLNRSLARLKKDLEGKQNA